MANVYIGIGTNVGDLFANCEEALRRLREYPGIDVKEVSSLYGTKPVGGPDQDDFLNGVLKIETEISPEECLELLKSIETEMGRENTEVNHPRIMDLDILIYDDIVVNSEELTIPHPRMREREFVLKGLRQIAPELV